MKYGLLTVIRQYQKNHGNRNRLFVECVCDCGNVVERRLDGLKQGHNTDCGCLKKGEIEALIGKKYGIITVTGTHKNYRGDTMTDYVCDCGKISKTASYNLSRIKSCGCLSLIYLIKIDDEE